jgi:DNA anti-recombination protein RmuC
VVTRPHSTRGMIAVMCWCVVCLFLAKLDADRMKATPSKRIFHEVDKSVDLRAELRALQSDNRDFRERETEFRRQNRKLKAQIEQEKQEHAHDIAKFKASITALGTQLEGYRAQMETDRKGMGEKFAQEYRAQMEMDRKGMGEKFAQEYHAQRERDHKLMGEKFAQELANAKESRYKILLACLT